MSTFIGQLIGFAAIVFLVLRYVVPPVRRLMTARQEAVRQQLKDSAAAARSVDRVDHGPQQSRGGSQVGGETDGRRGPDDAERIAEQMRAQADVEAERIKVAGCRQVELLRTQLVRQLRLELGHESVRQAGELVRDLR